MTADCTRRVIATDAADDNKLIAAIRHGWQGLSKKYYCKTVQKWYTSLILQRDNATAEMHKGHSWVARLDRR